MVELVPSILSADFSKLGLEIEAAERGGGSVIHVDIMDGHFVPNLTMGPPVVKSLRKVTTLPLDCHLMIENPDDFIYEFADAGANWISVHYEACSHLHRTLQLIAQHGMEPAVVINPATRVDLLIEILPMVHHVLVMSVNPGFGGQKFIPFSLDKIRQLVALRAELGSELQNRGRWGRGPRHHRLGGRSGRRSAGRRQRRFRFRTPRKGCPNPAQMAQDAEQTPARAKFPCPTGRRHLTLSKQVIWTAGSRRGLCHEVLCSVSYSGSLPCVFFARSPRPLSSASSSLLNRRKSRRPTIPLPETLPSSRIRSSSIRPWRP